LKYNTEKEQYAREWLETLLGEKFEEKVLQEALKSGERLCTAINKVSGAQLVKTINKQKMAAMQRENLAAYIRACSAMSFNKANLFETSDLFEGKNMVLVINNIYELAARGAKKGFGQIKDPSGKGGYDVSQVSDTSSSGYISGSSGES